MAPKKAPVQCDCTELCVCFLDDLQGRKSVVSDKPQKAASKSVVSDKPQKAASKSVVSDKPQKAASKSVVSKTSKKASKGAESKAPEKASKNVVLQAAKKASEISKDPKKAGKASATVNGDASGITSIEATLKSIPSMAAKRVVGAKTIKSVAKKGSVPMAAGKAPKKTGVSSAKATPDVAKPKQVTVTPPALKAYTPAKQTSSVAKRVPTPGPTKKTAKPLKVPVKPNTKTELKDTRMTRSNRSELVFPVSRVENTLRSEGVGRMSETVPVFLAGVVQYITSEVMDMAGEQATKEKKKRIQPQHVKRGVAQDGELYTLMKDSVFPGAGIAFPDTN